MRSQSAIVCLERLSRGGVKFVKARAAKQGSDSTSLYGLKYSSSLLSAAKETAGG